MNKTFKNRVAIIVGTLGLAWGSLANASTLANVSGNWTILGNQTAGVLSLSQGTSSLPCAPIKGTIYGVNAVVGYYCPATGRIAFIRKNTAGVANQTWVGNVSDIAIGGVYRMGGTFHALDYPAGSGILGEVPFQGQK